jgi:undecaprenyl-diphosphatase
VASTALFVLAAVLLVSPTALPLDALVSAWIRSMHSPALTALAKGFSVLAGVAAISAFTSIGAVFLFARKKVAAAVYLLFSVVPGWLVASLLKGVFTRPRPQGVSIVPLPIDFSLPSGHTAAAALCYGALAVLVVVNAQRLWPRVLAPVVVAIVVMGVAWSRVYLGVHWAGDVAAGLLFSAAWLGFCTVSYLGSLTESQRRAEAATRV